VVLPSRVDALLLRWLRSLPWPVVVVLHVNHPGELSAELREALAALAGTGARLLNQSVLLRGINDEAGVLARLSRELLDAGVIPYYLHALDRARGTAHFEVPDAKALALHAELAATLPGYLVPRLVREVEGASAKRPVHASAAQSRC
jgi:L-lysine 2,3-aminomutase